MGKWTRRAFLSAGVLAGGGILVGVALRPGNRNDVLAPFVEGDGEKLVHAYIKIDQDNVVTAIIPHSEMGQGAHTALAQMLADELDADWNLVRVEEAPAIGDYSLYSVGRGFLFQGIDFPDLVIPTIEGVMMRLSDSLDLQVTGGSMSVRVTGTYGMRVAGAATRDMLKRAAAKAWGVAEKEITTEKSMLIHTATSRRAPYAEFAAAAAEMTPSYTPKLKDIKDYKLMGQHKPRFDIPAKVDGSAKFALDVCVPGMVYATVKRAPVFGGTVKSLDDRAARAIEGVLDVVTLPVTSADMMIGGFAAGEAVAVVAEGYWAAQRGLRALDIQWDDKGNGAVSSADIAAQHQRDIEAGADRKSDHSSGNIDDALARAETVVSADYTIPYLAHTCMEPLNATADYRDDQCEIWVGCQNPLGFRRAVADVLGLDEEQITFHNLLMGGGFGRKSRPDWAMQAALLSKAVGKPVQLIWSREEDVRQDFYRPASRSEFRAGLSQDGELLGWQNTYVNKQEPAEAPLIPYAIEAQDIGYVQSPSHVPWGAWRSVDESMHGFFTESFIDECAVVAGKDPYEYRANMLKAHPRHLAVLNRAAEEAGWGAPLGQGRSRGIALKESFGSIVAQVAEISIVNEQVIIDRMVAVIDPGFAVAPDGVVAQIESGIIYGLTAAIYGEITIEDGAVQQSNFHDYPALRMTASPVIETHIINSGYAPGGAGEPGTPPAASALANAIYAATGKRLRDLPLNKHIAFAEGGRA